MRVSTRRHDVIVKYDAPGADAGDCSAALATEEMKRTETRAARIATPRRLIIPPARMDLPRVNCFPGTDLSRDSTKEKNSTDRILLAGSGFRGARAGPGPAPGVGLLFAGVVDLHHLESLHQTPSRRPRHAHAPAGAELGEDRACGPLPFRAANARHLAESSERAPGSSRIGAGRPDDRRPGARRGPRRRPPSR